jgi:hypothetical protein
MRGDAVFGDLVHLAGADLQFDALLRRADDGGVDGPVVVLLRRRDVVLEAAGHGVPLAVDDAERAVAVVDIVDDDAEAEHIGQLLEGQRLRFHLAEDRPRLFLAAVDLRLDAVGGEQVLQRVGDLGQGLAVVFAEFGQPVGDGAVASGLMWRKASSSSSSRMSCMPMRPASGA